MELSIPSELQQFVDHQVALGAYASPSDVVGDALRLLQLHERDRTAMTADLRRKIAVGIKQLELGDAIGAREVFRELRERNDAARAGSP